MSLHPQTAGLQYAYECVGRKHGVSGSEVLASIIDYQRRYTTGIDRDDLRELVDSWDRFYEAMEDAVLGRGECLSVSYNGQLIDVLLTTPSALAKAALLMAVLAHRRPPDDGTESSDRVRREFDQPPPPQADVLTLTAAPAAPPLALAG